DFSRNPFSVPWKQLTQCNHYKQRNHAMSNNLPPKAILRRAFCAVLGIQMMALPVALAQQATNQPVKMEKTVVTVSLIPTAETVGGVNNIITKRDFNGAEVSAHYGFGLDKGNYNEYRFSIVAGYSKDGTRVVAGGQYYYADPLYTKDRSIGSLSPQQLGAAGLNAPSYVSPSYPGRVGSFILAGSPLAVGAPGYIAGLNAPPVVSGGPFNTVQDYNTAALSDPTWNAQHPGMTPYIPITSTPASQALGGTASILNTTLLNTMTLQRQDRRTAFANVEQDIFGDHLTAYGQLIYSESESAGQLAPAPIP